MIKKIAIIAGEPNSISSEIIFKVWKLKNKFTHKSFFIIGNIDLLNKQKKKLKYSLKIKKINGNLNARELNKNHLPVYNIDYKQKKPFEKINYKSSKYILKCFDKAINFVKLNKIQGLINCPISKKYLLKNKYDGITELLAEKFKVKGNEVMLLFNKKLSVSPITTHIPLNKVHHQINKRKIIKKIKIINDFYKLRLKKKPIIGVLGLNPHSYSEEKKSEEKKIIIPALHILKKKKIRIVGPIPPDSSFLNYKQYNLDVVVGMYHDQVLTTFKSLFGYKAVNVTLGLPIVRTSPDHGIAEDIIGKKRANPNSLLEAIKFFNYIK